MGRMITRARREGRRLPTGPEAPERELFFMTTTAVGLSALAAAATLVQACGNPSNSAPGASKDATAGPNEASSSSGSGGAPEMLPPGDAGACPNLPSLVDGGWLSVSPPGSNYANTYSGINAVAVR